jgi:hypothetical protein
MQLGLISARANANNAGGSDSNTQTNSRSAQQIIQGGANGIASGANIGKSSVNNFDYGAVLGDKTLDQIGAEQKRLAEAALSSDTQAKRERAAIILRGLPAYVDQRRATNTEFVGDSVGKLAQEQEKLNKEFQNIEADIRTKYELNTPLGKQASIIASGVVSTQDRALYTKAKIAAENAANAWKARRLGIWGEK